MGKQLARVTLAMDGTVLAVETVDPGGALTRNAPRFADAEGAPVKTRTLVREVIASEGGHFSAERIRKSVESDGRGGLRFTQTRDRAILRVRKVEEQ